MLNVSAPVARVRFGDAWTSSLKLSSLARGLETMLSTGSPGLLLAMEFADLVVGYRGH